MNRRIVVYVSSLMFLFFAVPPTFAQSWAYTGRLNHDRTYHTETLLKNGRSSLQETSTMMATQWRAPNYIIQQPEPGLTPEI